MTAPNFNFNPFYNNKTHHSRLPVSSTQRPTQRPSRGYVGCFVSTYPPCCVGFVASWLECGPGRIQKAHTAVGPVAKPRPASVHSPRLCTVTRLPHFGDVTVAALQAKLRGPLRFQCPLALRGQPPWSRALSIGGLPLSTADSGVHTARSRFCAQSPH